MKEKIIDRLEKFEEEKNIRIILAVESGSRGWGFASADSDYDIRFIYTYPKEEYLNLKRPPSYVEWMEGGQADNSLIMDFVGFDIYKFYDLLLQSNMNKIDYLFQDNIYIDRMLEKSKLKKNIAKGFNRQTYIAHNYGLCKKNYHKYFVNPSENEPTAKRYVYCLRAVLSAHYCASIGNVAPLDFNELLDESTCIDEKDKTEIREMIELKKKTKEKKWYKNDKWEQFIESFLKSEQLKSDYPHNKEEYYDVLNKSLLMQLWDRN